MGECPRADATKVANCDLRVHLENPWWADTSLTSDDGRIAAVLGYGRRVLTEPSPPGGASQGRPGAVQGARVPRGAEEASPTTVAARSSQGHFRWRGGVGTWAGLPRSRLKPPVRRAAGLGLCPALAAGHVTLSAAPSRHLLRPGLPRGARRARAGRRAARGRGRRRRQVRAVRLRVPCASAARGRAPRRRGGPR